MGKIIILNGSPRAPKSNSKEYAEIFARHAETAAEYFNISKSNHLQLCSALENCTDVLLVFPLYVDGIPSTLLNFLKTLEKHSPEKKPAVSVLVNCGFLEYMQNDTAVDMVKLFCRQNGYPIGSVLKIGSGEAILNTPFRFLAERRIKKLASSVCSGNYGTWTVTMSLPKRLFLKASTKYWINYGKKYGTSEDEMRTMKIE